MAKLRLSTSSIDLDALPPLVRRRVEYALETGLSDHQAHIARSEAIKSGDDARLIAEAEREYPGAPIGLSTWYRKVSPCQETRYSIYNKKRPVFMRGGKQVLIRLYCRSNFGSSPNGWAAAVYWRALRMSRRTFMNHGEFETFSNSIIARLNKKYFLTYHFDSCVGVRYCDWDRTLEHIRIIGGKLVYLTNEQKRHIEGLHAIVQRAERLDGEARKALVRQGMLERLAA
jgi:hypothetical protein